jgi:hypothetical protein
MELQNAKTEILDYKEIIKVLQDELKTKEFLSKPESSNQKGKYPQVLEDYVVNRSAMRQL